MPNLLKLKDTTQYMDAMKSTNNSTESVSESNKLRFDITNSVYDEISRIVTEKGLVDIYSQIDFSNAPTPISFAFKLKTLEVFDYRSIEYYKLDFDSIVGKVIYNNGNNGSGKSSLIHALRDALLGDRVLSKNNRKISDNEYKDCTVKVSLIYNDKVYYIGRGPGWTTFAIDDPDNLITKSGKRELESYIFSELPFLNYLHYFILETNYHFFDNIDRTALIKTCFNLEIFDYILSSTNELYNEYYTKLDDYKQITLKEIDYQNRLSEDIELNRQLITTQSESIPNGVTIDSLNTLKNQASDKYIQANNLYNKLVGTNTALELYRKQLGDINLLNKEDIELKLSYLTELDRITTLIKNTESQLSLDNNYLSQLKSQYNSISDASTYCPHCNKVLSKDEHYEVTKKSLEDSMESYAVKVLTSTKELDNLSIEFTELTNKYPNLRPTELKSKSEYESELALVNNASNLITEFNRLSEEFINVSAEYSKVSEELKVLTNGLKYNEFIDNVTNLIVNITKLDNLKSNNDTLIKKLSDSKNKVVDIESNMSTIESYMNRIMSFRDLFDQKSLDSIPYSIISTILKSMDTPKLRFSSSKELSSGEERFEVNCHINIANPGKVDKWINYDSMSHGQKVIADLFILEHIINLLGNVGLLVMDESLSNLDEVKYANALSFFENTYCDKILVVSHNPNFDGADYTLNYSLNDDSITEITENY